MDKTTTLNGKSFLHYQLKADLLCLGERIRGGIFRPCLEVFTYTGLAGALKSRFPHPYRSIHAVGRFRHKSRHILVFSPRDRGREVSAVPLEIEYLADVEADLYVQLNDFTATWPDHFTLRLGAMKSKGFGECRVDKIGEVKPGEPKYGKLAVRLPDDPVVLEALGVMEVKAPVYGYLFRPDRGGTGHYELGLFENSIVKADPILLKE
ncbi:MAG: hypothetical protein N3B12_01140 [Armatimonadetes bacterium]|nr:hypothetical protein [Armatimonadota bacterium]